MGRENVAVGIIDILTRPWERDHMVTRVVLYCVVSPSAPLNTILPVMPCAMSVLLSLKKVFKTFV